jgi:hypothetical protein
VIRDGFAGKGFSSLTLVRNADGIQVSLRHFPDDALLFA